MLVAERAIDQIENDPAWDQMTEDQRGQDDAQAIDFEAEVKTA